MLSRALSGKVETGFPSESAITLKRALSGKVETGFPSESAIALKRAVSGMWKPDSALNRGVARSAAAN
jgi:hypothetical protein